MKLLKLFTTILLIFSFLPTFSHATSTTQTEIISFEDGSYLTVELTTVQSRSTSRTASKTYHYHNLLGTEEWYATLTGTFTYDGTTSKCTLSGVTIGITDSSWYIVSRESHEEGDTAYGTVVMGVKFLGITTDKKTVNMSLTCDKNGNLS